MPDCSAGGLLADQAVLPLNIHRGSTSASMNHADAATETQGDRQKQVPTVRADAARNVATCNESEIEDSTTALP